MQNFENKHLNFTDPVEKYKSWREDVLISDRKPRVLVDASQLEDKRIKLLRMFLREGHDLIVFCKKEHCDLIDFAHHVIPVEFLEKGIGNGNRFEEDIVILHRDLMNLKIERNHKCPCGSGKKFKKCCLQSLFYMPIRVRHKNYRKIFLT